MNLRRFACLLFLATTSVGHTVELTLEIRDASGPIASAVVALIAPVGSSVDFPNRDNTQHHVDSFS
jgi:hypothetical protein